MNKRFTIFWTREPPKGLIHTSKKQQEEASTGAYLSIIYNLKYRIFRWYDKYDWHLSSTIFYTKTELESEKRGKWMNKI